MKNIWNHAVSTTIARIATLHCPHSSDLPPREAGSFIYLFLVSWLREGLELCPFVHSEPVALRAKPMIRAGTPNVPGMNGRGQWGKRDS